MTVCDSTLLSALVSLQGTGPAGSSAGSSSSVVVYQVSEVSQALFILPVPGHITTSISRAINAHC